MGLLSFIPFSVASALTLVVGSGLVYLATLAIYRLYFHPLTHIPGPKLAAVTYFYEFYWDVVQPGRLTWHLQDLHDKYGPILRICPDEVHIRDPTYYDELYARSTGRRHKLPRFSGRFGFKAECFSTWQHDTHRMRRNAINPFFSVQKVTNLQPVIRSNLTKLTKVFTKAAESGTTVPANLAFMALTGDITTTYAFAHSYNQLDSPNFSTTYDDTLKALYTLGNLTLHFPIIFAMIDASPPWLTNILNPVVMPIVNFYADCERQISDIRTGLNKNHEIAENPTIFHEMLLTSTLPVHEKTDTRLGNEAVEIVAAGIITTSWALTVGTYHIAANPEIQRKLQAELRGHIPHPLNLSNIESNKREIDWHRLEPLPYLAGCIREAIRLSGGVVTRAPRIAPDDALHYKDHIIPPGNAVSMTTWHVSHDESIFPDPETFRPERWMKPNGSRNLDMEKWVVAFGKGARQCAGINLAFAELHVILATLFRSFEVGVDESVRWERDIKVSHAYLVPYPDLVNSRNIGVRVRKVED